MGILIHDCAGERDGYASPPKEQPPRKLSGSMDRVGNIETLWKVSDENHSTDGRKRMFIR